jgi:hypothetical protein
MKHRWPRAIHSQVEAVFHAIRSVREAQVDSPQGLRSFGSWKVYRYEAHRFARSLPDGVGSLLDTPSVRDAMAAYLD